MKGLLVLLHNLMILCLILCSSPELSTLLLSIRLEGISTRS